MVPEFSQTARRLNATMTDYVQALIEEGYVEGDPSSWDARFGWRRTAW